MNAQHQVVIVGAGHGGTQAALSLRQLGFEGGITLLGDDPHPPYQRPPLSKDYLSGASAFDRILIRPADHWAEKRIDCRTGARVEAVDVATRSVRTADGARLGYDTLVWAAGGEARRLACEGHDLPGIHHIRRRDDVDTLAAELPGAERIVIVGGGYIGLEAASVLVGTGKHVTVVETADRVLARVAGAPLSRFYERTHAAHGVTIHLSTTVARIVAERGRAAGVMLASGEILPADIVIVGIGLVPNVAPLLAAGATGTNGVDVDPLCRTGLPDIYAIGDCAAHANPFAGEAPIRLESVQNAHDQAMVVARAICGQPAPYNSLPWFWSTQYDLRLQTVGLSTGHDALVVRGDMASDRFSIVYLRDGRVIALDCVNAAKDYAQGRALILSGDRLPHDQLADPAMPLKRATADA